MVTKHDFLDSYFEDLSYSSEIIDGNKTKKSNIYKLFGSYSSEIIDGNKTHNVIVY